MMKRAVWLSIITLLGLSISFGQTIPKVPIPPRLVNDIAQIFTPEQIVELEQKLVAYEKESSNEIVVVTLNELDGVPGDIALGILREWGVGNSKKNNGIVILLKPRTKESKGEIAIQVGYGLEGVLPDSKIGRIIDNTILPHLREYNYYYSMVIGTQALMEAMGSEFVSDEDDFTGNPLTKKKLIEYAVIAVGFIVIMVILYRKEKKNRKDDNDDEGNSGGGGSGGRKRSSLPPIMRGGFGRFGGGSGGGSSGGFGGFGGGSGGGGGAGRSF